MSLTRPYVERINTGGNYCGHYPAYPNFLLARPAKKGKGGIPRVLTLCMERIENYYSNPKTILPSLNLANGSAKQQSSARRESCVLILKSLIQRTDLVSLRVGQPLDGKFLNYEFKTIVKDTGLNKSRVVRAIKDLKAAEIITVSQPREKKEDGSWKGLAAVKAISKHLFGAMGLYEMLDRERKKAAKRKKKKEIKAQQPTTKTQRARLRLMLNSLMEEVQEPLFSEHEDKVKDSVPT